MEEGRGFAAETVGPELWRAKGLEEAPVARRPIGVQEHCWVPKCNLAYRMLYSATPLHHSHSLLKSALLTGSLCGLVFFPLAGDGGDGIED